MRQLFGNRLIEAGVKATELAFNLKQKTDEPIVIAVEDTKKSEVIGYGKVFISTEYYHPKMSKCSNNQKLHLRRHWSYEQMKAEICDFLRRVSILPMQVETSDGDLIDLGIRQRKLIAKHGVSKALVMTEELILKHSTIEVQLL